MIVHVRVKQPKRGGNQYYRDRSLGVAATLCGAPCTSYDVAYREKIERWTRDDGLEFIPCEACKARR
jgi:hypothetical protein